MSTTGFETARFFACVDSTHKLDPAQAEVAFVGRSNVGKSSLINALCGRRALAKSSKTPGKTRTINVYSLGEGRWIVDLPGYGFASVSMKERVDWKYMIEDYFASRQSLKAVFMLVDAHVGPTALDRQMLARLKSEGTPYRIIVNKIDRAAHLKLIEQREGLASQLDVAPEHILWVSAKKGAGIKEVRSVLSGFLEGGVER